MAPYDGRVPPTKSDRPVPISPDKSVNVYVLLGLVVTWFLIVDIMILTYLNNRAIEATACRAAEKLVTVLEYVPYQLRATDCATVIPSINEAYNIETTFFETDDTHREYNLFSLHINSAGNQIQGLTNWISYRVILNEPSTFARSCFDIMNSFRFKGDNATR